MAFSLLQIDTLRSLFAQELRFYLNIGHYVLISRMTLKIFVLNLLWHLPSMNNPNHDILHKKLRCNISPYCQIVMCFKCCQIKMRLAYVAL